MLEVFASGGETVGEVEEGEGHVAGARVIPLLGDEFGTLLGVADDGPFFQVAQLVEAEVDGQLLLHAPAAIQLCGIFGGFPGLLDCGFTVYGDADAAMAGIEAVGTRTSLFKFVPVDFGEGLVVGPADVGPDEAGFGECGRPGRRLSGPDRQARWGGGGTGRA